MKIIEPKVELWQQGDDAKAHVARCARVCYGRERGNDQATIKRLITSKHWSMFRHESVYAIIPIYEKELENYLLLVASCPYIQVHTYYNSVYIATNEQFILDKSYPKFIELINMYRVTEDEFSNTEIGFNMMRYTFCIDTQISTSRELNRVSPNNIAEMSTRYVYEDGSICRPHWMTDEEVDYLNNEPIFEEWCNSHKKASIYRDSCNNSFNKYKLLVDIGMHRQDARGVLPLDTATRCVYTYSIDEWFDIIRKRVYNTTGKAHPNATIICKIIEQELNGLGYEVKI
nr:MAG: Thymidylate synthase complementing protein [Bacteriophage sp.]